MAEAEKMELMEITADEYGDVTSGKCLLFCSKDFLELNRGKVDKVRYFLGRDTRRRFAFAVGEKDGEWRAPFSAPFSTVVPLRKNTDLEHYWEFIALLNQRAKAEEIRKVSIFLPPDIYGAQQNAKLINSLIGNGYRAAYQELNYSLNVKNIDPNAYIGTIQHNARKNLKIALNSGLELQKCGSRDEKIQAYQVIQANRESKGYPLRMTQEQVMETIEIVPHDIFLVNRSGLPIAAAIIFRVWEKTAQVIYWGDVPDVGQYKPINFLSYELIKYYQKEGIEQIDIGPSTENGIPNFGLCSFKESIGCEASGKYRYEICF